MRILYPENPLDKTQADTPYQPEFAAALTAGHDSSLFDFDALAWGEFRPRPRIQPGEPVLYRGWMLNSKAYQDLIHHIERQGGLPITSHDHYLKCHYLSSWYHNYPEFTAETHFFTADEMFESRVKALNWDCYFVKDFVKSNTAGLGSIAYSVADVRAITEELQTYRGEIEGGIAIRRVEDYRPNTERRYFVVRGQAYASDSHIPALVHTIAQRMDAPFYSVDIIENSDGDLRLVELGDGQVSDKKSWPISEFIKVMTAIAS